jgi:hypothetical protein
MTTSGIVGPRDARRIYNSALAFVGSDVGTFELRARYSEDYRAALVLGPDRYELEANHSPLAKRWTARHVHKSE